MENHKRVPLSANMSKELPSLPTVVENDNFEDISLDPVRMERSPPRGRSDVYLLRKQSIRPYSKENLTVGSNANLLNSRKKAKTDDVNHTLNNTTNLPVISSDSKFLTPSQRLKLRRAKLNEDINKMTRTEVSTKKEPDFSDDELPDDAVAFNVPFSQSLSQIANKEKLVVYSRPKTESITDSTRTSSILSMTNTMDTNSSVEDMDSMEADKSVSTIIVLPDTQINLDDYHLDADAQELTIAFNQNEMIQLHEETRERRESLLSLKSGATMDSFTDHIGTKSADSSKRNSAHSPKRNKDSFLTITRPDWLPPKDNWEKSKHKYDYENLIHQALTKEKSQEKKQQARFAQIQKQRAKDVGVWEDIIMNNYRKQITLTSTREMWWRGVPSNLRPRIWGKQIGNKLGITVEQCCRVFEEVDAILAQYNRFCQLSSDAKESLNQQNPALKQQFEILRKINTDLVETFPDMVMFQNEDNCTDLKQIIVAYLVMNEFKSNHYFTGVTTLTAVLHHHFQNKETTLINLANLQDRGLIKLLISYTNPSLSELDRKILSNDLSDYVNSFNKMFEKKLNRLYTHFKIIGLTDATQYFIETLPNVFSNIMNFNKSCLLMDIFLFEGDSFLSRVLLGLFANIGYKLYGDKKEVMEVIGYENRRILNGKQSMKGVYKYMDLGFDDQFIEDIRQVIRD